MGHEQANALESFSAQVALNTLALATWKSYRGFQAVGSTDYRGLFPSILLKEMLVGGNTPFS